MYCINCGNKLDKWAMYCPKCGVYTDNYIKSMRDKPSFILEFFSFFFPLFGFIIYWALHNNKPNRADLCLRYAAFGFFMNILIGIINFIGTTING
jgi:uncharacterized membrane protein YvbJ